MIRKITLGIASLAVTFLMSAVGTFAATPNWNVSGNWDLDMMYSGNTYAHDLNLMQDASGGLTGNGGYPANDTHTFDWTLTSGQISGNDVNLTAKFTMGEGVLDPFTIVHASGSVASDGRMSGTWSGNYQGTDRSGTWSTSNGIATAMSTSTASSTLTAGDFGVVNYDSGQGIIKGYTAGFELNNSTLAGASSVVVKLYGAGDTLLQTNTAIISKFNTDITGVNFSSPFDVDGTFNYMSDGYWTNVRASEYGQSIPATKVIATVTLQNGQVVTAENSSLTGDPTILYPDTNTEAPVLGNVPSEVTIPELSMYSFHATATGSDDGMLTYSLMGAPAGAMINATSGVFLWTPTEMQGAGNYTFTVMVSDGELTDSQQIIIHVTEVGNQNGNHPNSIAQCKNGGYAEFTDPSFRNQGQCISYLNQQNYNNDNLQHYIQLLELLKRLLLQLQNSH